MIKKIIIDEKLRDLVESYDYEVNARKQLIAFMLSNNMDINTEAFNRYQREMRDFMVLFENAKNDISEIYVDPIRGNSDATWSLSYKDCTLSIDIADQATE